MTLPARYVWRAPVSPGLNWGTRVRDIPRETPPRRKLCVAHREGQRPEVRDEECHACRRDLIAERAAILRRRAA